MSVDLQELFDKAGRTAPPPRLDPETVLHAARRRRSRRRLLAGGAGVAVAAGVAAVAVAVLTPGSGGDHAVGTVTPSVTARVPDTKTAFWYFVNDPVARTDLVVVQLDNDASEPVTVSGFQIDRDPTGAVQIDGVLSGVQPVDPAKTTISLGYLAKLDHPAPAAVDVPAHRTMLVVLRVRPRACGAIRVVPGLTWSVRLRSASGAESTLVVRPDSDGSINGWIDQAVAAACGSTTSG